MELILWRHAEAEDVNAKGDLARELTPRGRGQAQRMAAWLKPRLEGEWRVVASPAVRVLQTLAPLGRDFDVSEALAPGQTPEALLGAVRWPASPGHVIAVGHEPTLGEAAGILLGAAHGNVPVRKGAVWWFSTHVRDGKPVTVLKAVVDPDMVEE